MNRIQALVNTENFIFYKLPEGKPDPTEPCTPETLVTDNRKRTLQKPYKGNTCWHYTLNMIRDRIGKHPSPELEGARQIEKLCSERRKQVTKHELSLPTIFSQLNTIGNMFKGWDHAKVATLISLWDTLYAPILDGSLSGGPSLLPILKDFLQQTTYKNFLYYAYDVKAEGRAEAGKKFLKYFGYTPADFFEAEKSAYPLNYKSFGGCSWSELPKIEQKPLIDLFARLISSKVYGLVTSSWNPSQPLHSLISELRQRGALVVNGSFGFSAYTENPHKTKEQAAGQDVFGWGPGTRRQDTLVDHSVTVIGAQKNGEQEFVYYVDSADAAQRTYVISYKALKENIRNLHSCMKDVEISPSVGYALASNRPPIHDQV